MFEVKLFELHLKSTHLLSKHNDGSAQFEDEHEGGAVHTPLTHVDGSAQFEDEHEGGAVTHDLKSAEHCREPQFISTDGNDEPPPHSIELRPKLEVEQQ